MTTTTLAARASLIGLGLFSAACSEYEFAEQDLGVRYLADSQQISLQVDTRGLYGTSLDWSDSDELIVKRARDRVRRMAAGERYLHLLSFPLIFDLDAKPGQEREERPGEEDWISAEDATRLRAVFLENVRVESSRVYLDAEGEVSVAQSFRIDKADACVAALNEVISLGVRRGIEDVASSGDDVSEMFASARSRENLRSFLEAGGRWLTLSEKSLEVRVPMTPADLAILLKGFAEDDPKGSTAALGRALLGGLEELAVENDVALFRFPVSGDGAVHWTYRGERHPDAKKLRAAFDEGELSPR
ncbi:hypothetical protein Poly30_43390 [Planctomycetes bacterium Poly30]|uniref:Uncharacterized protein n=1 Tax=Saltatorellus ferox TaxID=2528018 RepID=A0A518EXF5_9BACT|nr:hypothetical protein Poly30_43390 [Planctomycetes bacterium Poly30]